VSETKLTRARRYLGRDPFPRSIQRNYNYTLSSIKMGLLTLSIDSDAMIQSVEHPFFQFENMGEYKSYIGKVQKPPEMTITFIEDDLHTIGRMLDIWDSLKWNKATGILYPKAVYEDQAILTYFGSRKASIARNGNNITIDSVGLENTVRYSILGFYPITRGTHTMADSDNGVLQITVPFNVDDISLLI